MSVKRGPDEGGAHVERGKKGSAAKAETTGARTPEIAGAIRAGPYYRALFFSFSLKEKIPPRPPSLFLTSRHRRLYLWEG